MRLPHLTVTIATTTNQTYLRYDRNTNITSTLATLPGNLEYLLLALTSELHCYTSRCSLLC